MVYDVAWDESLPDGSENANTLETEIQELKESIRERLEDFFPDWSDDSIDPKLPVFGYPRARLAITHSAANATVDPVDWTDVSVQTEEPNTLFDEGTSTTDIVIPANLGGFYQINVYADFTANATGARREVQIRINDIQEAAMTSGFTDGSAATYVSASWAGQLSAADTIDVRLYQDSGITLNVACELSVYRIHS